MWPWEHLALGYLLVSVAYSVGSERRPTSAEALVVVLGTQLPDLIDKPLAWTFSVLPSGLSLGHSLLFALPVSVAVLLYARARGRPWIGVAFGIAYGSHLLGDVLFTVLTGGGLVTGFLLWPLVPTTPDAGAGFAAQFVALLGSFRTFLATPTGRLYLLFEVGLLVSAALAWYRDGRPGFPRAQALSGRPD
jgi:hypothetical protein